MENCSSKDIWIVIPAFNEDSSLLEVLYPLTSSGYSVVVVDDGSVVPLRSFLTNSQIYLIRHPINLGQGAALRTGIDFAVENKARFIVTFDADGQHLSSEIPRLIEPLIRGECLISLGSRFLRDGRVENIPFRKWLVLKLAVLLTRISTGLELSDTHNGFRAMTAEAATMIDLTQNRMSHASEILRSIAKLKIAFKEVPVTIRYTEYSMRKGQRISNAFNILWESLSGRV